MSKSRMSGSGGRRRVVTGVGALQERLWNPACVVGGVEAGVDCERFGGAPASKGLNGGRRAASNKKGARETDAEASEAVLGRVGLGHERAEEEAEITVDRGVRHGAKGFCAFEK